MDILSLHLAPWPRFAAAALTVLGLACQEAGSPPAVAEAQAPALAGDLNRDRAVNIADLQLLVNVLLGRETNPLVVERADFDANGRTEVADLQKLVNLLLSCGGSGDACTCTPGGAPGVADQSQSVSGVERSTTDVQIADLNKDGRPDIIWASQFGGGVSPPGGIDVSLNLGGGNFNTVVVGDESNIGSWSFVLPVDVTGDGFADLVTTRPANSVTEVSLFRNDTRGGFTQVTTAFPSITGPVDGLVYGRAAAADIDGDGDLDVLVPVSFSSDFTHGMPNILLLNNGTGTFTRDTSGRLPALDSANNYTFCIATADVNGDGFADLFVGEGAQRQRLLINDGTGRFTDQSEDDGTGRARLPATAMRAYQCQPFDVDEDGDRDMVVVNDAASTPNGIVPQAAQLFVNDGTGHFTLRELPVPPGGPYDNRAVAIGDVNGDHLPDLVIANDKFTLAHGGRALEVLLGQCDGTQVSGAGLPNIDKGLLGVAVADFNGDGKLDIAGAVATQDAAGSYANVLLMGQ